MATLSKDSVAPHPVSQFKQWFQEALAVKVKDPNAMTLATASASGYPSARIVLLKSFDEYGFIFYTNYLSHKGADINENPRAALVFYWPEMGRQVRIEGCVEKMDPIVSEQYFHERPKTSQVSAVLAIQSQEISGRSLLEQRHQALTAQYLNKAVPRPLHWGGYLVRPVRVEFWQERAYRLHDRILYKQTDQKDWTIVRLAP